MEPYRDQYRQLESLQIPDDLTTLDIGRTDASSGEGNRQGDTGRGDEVREIDLASFLNPAVFEALSDDEKSFIQQSIGGGHETAMESDKSGNGEISTGEIQGNGAG
jgi:hypothetical protein